MEYPFRRAIFYNDTSPTIAEEVFEPLVNSACEMVCVFEFVEEAIVPYAVIGFRDISVNSVSGGMEVEIAIDVGD